MEKKRSVGVLTTLLLACFVLPTFIFAQNVTSSTLTEITEEAIKTNNVSEVKKAIENGADVNARFRNGNFILMRAIAQSSLEMVKLLIDNGADIHADELGMTTLMVAAMVGKAEIAKLLIEKGVDVNAKEDAELGGKTALHWCAIGLSHKEKNKEDSLEIAKLLIEKGADVNAKGTHGFTPLMEAASENFLEIAKLLIEKGADVNARYEGGYTALMLAAIGSVNAPSGSLDVAKLLIDKGADVNARGKDGATALKIAEEYAYNEIAALLKKHGAK